MLNQLAAIGQILWAQICSTHGSPAATHGVAGPLLGNIIVASVAGIITVACFVIAGQMLFHPGELDPDHPKRRILQPDR